MSVENTYTFGYRAPIFHSGNMPLSSEQLHLMTLLMSRPDGPGALAHWDLLGKPLAEQALSPFGLFGQRPSANF